MKITDFRRAVPVLAVAALAALAARAHALEIAKVGLPGASPSAPALGASSAGDAAPAPALPSAGATPAPLPSAPAAVSSAGPAQVILIRHGEKPARGSDLSPRGYERARALVGFFKTAPAVTERGLPAAIYAEQPRPDGSQSRPLETVQPLADSLGMTVNTSIRKPDAEGLARAVLSEPSYAGKMVLISWEHHMIPAIARALGADQAPDAWPDAAFDRVWIIDFDGGKPVRFRDLPQHLLPGDSAR